MLGLTLRAEFQGRRSKWTAIELSNDKKTGALQMPAEDFLAITYPSGDLLIALENIGPDQGRPLVLIGERGQGKTHLMVTLHHALTNSSATREWLQEWSDRIGNPKIAEIQLRHDMHVISESLHKQGYKYLWDLLLDNHPHGTFIRGKWEGTGDKKTEVLGYDLLLELFRHTPTALILDEFQTWFDGLTNAKQAPWKNRAFNFIQLLAEIAKDHPDLLLLVVSVRNGGTDAYQQIQRVGPLLVNFKAPNYKQDRQRLLLHRLFENRMNIDEEQIVFLSRTHMNEYLRLADVAPAEQERVRREFIEAWPFSPQLMELLEDQVLVATYAQETRDLIRILADLYKNRGDQSPILTAADFRLDDEKSAIAALLDSVANQHHAKLREKAERNLTAVRDAIKDPNRIPHLEEIVGALWLRSLAIGNRAGAEPDMLHVDITRNTVVDDNAFQAELDVIIENSFNIHQDGQRLVFREEENPQAKLLANARNDKQFVDGSDKRKLAEEIRYVLEGEDTQKDFRVIVLPEKWRTDPWSALDEKYQPTAWDDRFPILVLPEAPERLQSQLGTWLKEHLQSRRNAVRFLIPREGTSNVFNDRQLLVLSRAVYLAEQWKGGNNEYRKLHTTYEKHLQGILKRLYDRFAIVDTWNYQQPELCTFHVEAHKAEGGTIPHAIDEHIRKNLFALEDFEELVMIWAHHNDSVGKLLRELQEPRPGGEHSIPWLGETTVKERLIRMCARGRISINVRGTVHLQVLPGEDEESAWRRMRGGIGTGKHLDETYILTPQATAHTDATQTGGSNIGTIASPNGNEAQPTIGDLSGAYKPADGNKSPGEIFGAGAKMTSYSSDTTSALNLLARVESWGISTGTQVKDVSIKVGHLTGAQLSELLRKLPDGIAYELSLNKEEG